ncbi:unnamed protein product [marine sediment metagenome]|uniref:Uncharacterized protein n=1 Tax=marine sediment metagenome TaxID=412755 RepID=X1T1E6_9ZZZZ
MTIDEAIHILTQHTTRIWPASDLNLRNANQLGIEALKRLKAGRLGYTESGLCSLPGETKD